MSDADQSHNFIGGQWEIIDAVAFECDHVMKDITGWSVVDLQIAILVIGPLKIKAFLDILYR